MDNNLLTAKQILKLLNVSHALVYKMSERGLLLPSIRWNPWNWTKKGNGEVQIGGYLGIYGKP